MDYVIKLLKTKLRNEKYFGRSAVMMAAKSNVHQANAKMVQERIPQLEKAIEILSLAKEKSKPRKVVDYKISKHQLDLFKMTND